MSRREKISWVCLVTTVAVFVPYFIHLCRLLGDGAFRMGTVLSALFLVILVQCLLAGSAAVALTLRRQKEPRDERDAAVEARAYRLAYLVVGVLCSSLALGLPGLLLWPQAAQGDRAFALLLGSQTLLFCFVLAEVTRYLTMAVGYRRKL